MAKEDSLLKSMSNGIGNVAVVAGGGAAAFGMFAVPGKEGGHLLMAAGTVSMAGGFALLVSNFK